MQTHEAFVAVTALVGAGAASLPWTHGWLVEPSVASAHLVEVLEAPPPPAWVHDRPTDPYGGLQFDLEIQRQTLAEWSAEEDVHRAAQGLIDTYLPHLMRGWAGTGYSYSGTSEVPGEGKIACGYYVSTVLRDAGFDVDRVELARQASEQIVRTLVPDHAIQRFSWATRRQVVHEVVEQGPGVYIVGLDTHVGFLVNEAGQVTFCHSTQRGDMGVVCEHASSSPSLKSRYTVLGALRHATMVDAWLDGDRLPTAQKGQPQALFGTSAG